MTTLQDEFEALMPEPAAHRYMSHGHSSRWQLAGQAVPPSAEPLYTADQLRAAMQSVEERAAKKEREECAKLCEDECVEIVGDGDQAYNLAAEHCAAAIRAREGKGAA